MTDARVKDLRDAFDAGFALPAASVDTEDVVELLCVRVFDAPWAFRLSDLRGVARFRRVTRVPDAPRFVRGLVVIRGRLTPLVDLPGMLQGAGDDSTLCAIVAPRPELRLALSFQALEGRRSLPRLALSASEGRAHRAATFDDGCTQRQLVDVASVVAAISLGSLSETISGQGAP